MSVCLKLLLVLICRLVMIFACLGVTMSIVHYTQTPVMRYDTSISLLCANWS